jgi:formylglycine-generating enzyme required for sulfatase activity
MNRTTLFAALAAALLSNHAVAEPQQNRIKTEPDQAEMILVPAGAFIYGSDQNEIKSLIKKLKAMWDQNIFPTEIHKHSMTLPGFYIDRYEVTNEQYNNFVRANNHQPSRFVRFPQLNGPKQPVVGIGWNDAIAYCAWSNKRLPTEEEWEKAARGTDGRIWPWGNTPDSKIYNGKAIANYAPVEVGKFPQSDSPYGVSDMAGNVWEMTTGTWANGSKAMRGGSFLNHLADVRTTVRWAAGDENRGANWLGFRCAKNAE